MSFAVLIWSRKLLISRSCLWFSTAFAFRCLCFDCLANVEIASLDGNAAISSNAFVFLCWRVLRTSFLIALSISLYCVHFSGSLVRWACLYSLDHCRAFLLRLFDHPDPGGRPVHPLFLCQGCMITSTIFSSLSSKSVTFRHCFMRLISSGIFFLVPAFCFLQCRQIYSFRVRYPPRSCSKYFPVICIQELDFNWFMVARAFPISLTYHWSSYVDMSRYGQVNNAW